MINFAFYVLNNLRFETINKIAQIYVQEPVKIRDRRRKILMLL